MKKIYFNRLFLATFTLFTIIALMSSSSGRANVWGQAVTGAPGDTNKTCASSGCHASNAFSPNASLSIQDENGNMVSQYLPGSTYDVTLAIETSGMPSAYGFQMVALTADDSPATEWIDLGSNVQSVQLGERNYIEHNSPSSSNEFKTKWVAPIEAVGDITFYFAANAVNGNGSPTGDGGTSSTFVMSEFSTSSIDIPEVSITLFPNPANDVVTIKGYENEFCYSIFNINGKLVQKAKQVGISTLNISDLRPGLYFITLQNDNQNVTKKLIKN